MKAKILILAVFMGLTFILNAQPQANGQKKFRQNNKMEMKKGQERGPGQAFNLTDTQKEFAKKSMMAIQKQMQPMRNELGELMARQKSLTTVDNPDYKAINKNIEKMGELKTEMAKIQVKHKLEMRAQLTEEQRLMFDMHKGKMKHGNDRKGRMGKARS